MSLEEFWHTTPADYKAMMEGFKLRHDIEMQVVAWQTALLINVHSKKKVRPEQLLGKKQGMSTIEKEQKFAQLMQKLNKEPV